MKQEKFWVVKPLLPPPPRIAISYVPTGNCKAYVPGVKNLNKFGFLLIAMVPYIVVAFAIISPLLPNLQPLYLLLLLA